MPIRIDKDEEFNNAPRPRRDTGGGGNIPNIGGGGGIFSLLPLVLGIFGKNPKLLILLLLAAGAYYFFSNGCSAGLNAENQDQSLSTGLEMNSEKYKEAEIYEPLADNKKNPLPEKVSLLKFAPERLNQGRQGSCVGWASSYAARTILYSKQTGKNPNDVAFSPAHLYDKIALEGCQGAYLLNAMQTLHQKGNVPLENYPYNENSCSNKSNGQLENYAQNFKIKGYNRLSKGQSASNTAIDMLALKQNLAAGAPVVIGMMVGGSFMQPMEGQEKWIPTDRDYNMAGFGGHAMCVIGYDDYKFGSEGGFEIMNSWGPSWGKNGVGWVRYADFEHFTKEAWGLYPMGDANIVKSTKLNVNFSLVDNKSQGNIAMSQVNNNTYRTVTKMKVGQEFKIGFTNDSECYVYVFGEELDGSSYTLFPYTKKHSPYCGVTGTRLFPKDHSMFPDDKGTLDRFAVVVTKEPIDYSKYLQTINATAASNFEGKLKAVFGNELIQNVQFGSKDGSISFSAEPNGKNAAFVVLEVTK